MSKNQQGICPCGQLNKAYDCCCGPYILEEKFPTLPRLLMASRYSAYVMRDWDYIKRTQSGLAARRFNLDELKASQIEWLGLSILSEIISSCLTKAEVVFEARYLNLGVQCVLKENSQFKYESNRWFYTDSI